MQCVQVDITEPTPPVSYLRMSPTKRAGPKVAPNLELFPKQVAIRKIAHNMHRKQKDLPALKGPKPIRLKKERLVLNVSPEYGAVLPTVMP